MSERRSGNPETTTARCLMQRLPILMYQSLHPWRSGSEYSVPLEDSLYWWQTQEMRLR
ncbi:hypothetical protein BJV74DRAFT_805926 [Russula compacta]|nr:hypothetical protein BJV74DRAFT_805926 [Russula compacta]